MRAKSLRQSSTDAEKLLWYRLRNRQLLDLKFRRQRPIGKYFADFACVEIGLVIELDGGQHLEQVAYDAQREGDMKALGFTTLRFWDNEVLNETDAVMEKIWQVAQTLTPKTLTPALSRKREREQERDTKDSK
jgi:very-short-patch-repair endonuclease